MSRPARSSRRPRRPARIVSSGGAGADGGRAQRQQLDPRLAVARALAVELVVAGSNRSSSCFAVAVRCPTRAVERHLDVEDLPDVAHVHRQLDAGSRRWLAPAGLQRRQRVRLDRARGPRRSRATSNGAVIGSARSTTWVMSDDSTPTAENTDAVSPSGTTTWSHAELLGRAPRRAARPRRRRRTGEVARVVAVLDRLAAQEVRHVAVGDAVDRRPPPFRSCMPSFAPTSASITASAASTSSGISPPRKRAGSDVPETRFASVTVGACRRGRSTPGPGTRRRSAGRPCSTPDASSTQAMLPPPLPIERHVDDLAVERIAHRYAGRRS